MTIPTPAMLYSQGQGSHPQNVEIPFYSNRAPTSIDANYPIGKRWIDKTSSIIYSLCGFNTTNGATTALWVILQADSNIGGSGLSSALASGSTTVYNPAVISSSVIIIAPSVASGTVGKASVPQSSIAQGTFNIISDNIFDTSTFYYMIVN